MRIIILILILFCPDLISAQEIQLYETINYQQAVKNGTRSLDGKPGSEYWQNHANYTISVKLDTSENRLFGNERVEYFNESPDTLSGIVLRLYQNRRKKGAIKDQIVNPDNLHDGMILDTLIINGQGIDVPTSEQTITRNINDLSSFFIGTNLYLLLEESLLPGNSIEILCGWNYAIPGENDFRRTGYYRDDAWFIGYFYPQIAVYDDLEYFHNIKGWDLQLFHRGWQEFYNDFNNFDVTIEVPEGFYVWATGTLTNPELNYKADLLDKIEEARSSDSIICLLGNEDLEKDYIKGNKWHFTANRVPDFAFGTAKGYLWDATSVQVGNKRVFVDVAYHPKSALYSEAIHIARKTIEYASNIYPAIPYPWEHSTTFNGMLSGGMEFPMIANNGIFPVASINRYVTFHEIFHNYTPFMMGFNEKRYPFMDEGLTDYFSCRFLSDVYQEEFPSLTTGLDNRVKEYNYYAMNGDSPMFTAYGLINSHNVYYQSFVKPNMAYSLFIDMIGEDQFLKAFCEFVVRWKGKHPTPWDFFYTMNNVLGENYNWFWQAWFFELGYPDLGLELEKDGVIVNRIGALPLPVKLKIIRKDGVTETLTRTLDNWMDGERQIYIEIEDIESVKSIQLDHEEVPDIDHSNNYIEIM
jgi:hypothetical protein